MLNTQSHKKFSRLTGIVVWLVTFAIFSYLASKRLIAKDEGFYVMASKLVSEGKLPYLDFFYPQMPLLPFLYAIPIKIFGAHWQVLRMFSALLASGTCFLMFYAISKKTSFKAGLLGLALFVCSNFVFPWHLVVQTYSLSVFLLFAAFVIFIQSPRRLVWSGILFGLSISNRLFFAGLGPIFVLILFRDRESFREFFKSGAILTASTFIGLIPSIIFMLADYGSFYFNNLGYHLNRSGANFEASLDNKIRVAQVVTGLHETIKFDGAQFPILFWLACAVVLLSLLKRKKINASLYLAAGLFALNLIPTPTYVQYFASLMPFLVYGVVVSGSELVLDLNNKSKKILSFVILIIGIFYFKDTYKDIVRYTKSGIGVIGIRTEENAANLNVAAICEVSGMLNKELPEETEIISVWPGYLFESRHRAFQCLENHFGYRIAGSLPPDARKQMHLVTLREVSNQIRNLPKSYVLDHTDPATRNFRKAIAETGCQEISKAKNMSLFKCVNNSGEQKQ